MSSDMTLDIGCGGWCRGDVGVDISFVNLTGKYNPRALDGIAGRRNPIARLLKCDLDLEVLPFGDETFNMVKAIHILEHIRNPFAILVETHRVLMPGGVLLWICPNPLLSFLTDRTDRGHIYSWSPFTATNMLKAAGFTNTRWSLARIPTLDLCLRGAK